MIIKMFPVWLALLSLPLKGLAQAPFDTLFPIRTAQVYFDFGKADIRADAAATLRQLVKELPDSFKIAVRITAHTDAVGNPDANLRLSEARANAVRTALGQLGVADSIFTAKALGETHPIASNSTDEGKQLNRRATVEVVRPLKMITYRSKVVDFLTGKGIKSDVIIHNRIFRDTIQTDEDGNYTAAVPAGEIFGIDVYAWDYFYETRTLRGTISEINKINTLQLKPVRVGAKVAIQNLYFVGNQDTLLAISEPELPKVLKFMQYNSHISIEIGGHINRPNEPPVSEDSWNYDLSVRRAKRVYNYLIENGISADRLSYKGYGNWEMLYPKAKDAFQQAQNRRVEIKVVGMGE
ncbi:MAG: OmpA family protein [Saprospiraceae bacterium]